MDVGKYLSEQDSILTGITDKVSPLSFTSSGNVYHDLMSCVIEQQIHYRSTKKQFFKLLALADLELLSPENFSVLEEKALSQARLSENKQKALLAVNDFFKAGEPDWNRLSSREIRQTLTQIHGVGSQMADMILLFTLEHPDIFPAEDYHLKKLIADLYKPGKSLVKKDLEKISKKWAPYRSFAVRYLLSWKDYLKIIR